MSFMVETSKRVQCLQQLPFLQTTGSPKITQMSIGAAGREVLVEPNALLSQDGAEVAPKLHRSCSARRQGNAEAEGTPIERRSNAEATRKQRRSNAEATLKQRRSNEATPNHRGSNTKQMN